MRDKIRLVLYLLLFPAAGYVFINKVTVLTMLSDPIGLASFVLCIYVVVDLLTMTSKQEKSDESATAAVGNKANGSEATYRMSRSKELDDLIVKYNVKRPNGMSADELSRLYALTIQSGEKVDKEIAKIHGEVKCERDRRMKGTPQTYGRNSAKGYAPANPNARLNRAALDTTPDKVKKAQRKAGLRCPKCGSTNVTLLNNTAKSTSAGKAFIGAEAFGLEGMVVGAAMGKKGKREYLCNNCGKRYSVKN